MAEGPDVAVLKFGGSSFVELSDYQRVAGYLAGRIADGCSALVVVSGMSGTTGRLLEAARAIDPALQPEVQDQILATAEVVSASFLRAALAAAGCSATDLWAPQLGITGTGPAANAQIAGIDPAPVTAALASHQVVVVAGGQAVRPDGRIVMLGRNSSDLTAVALAAMLGVPACEVFSDVPGVYTADPHIVPSATLMSRVSYAQCAAMAASGAKVLHTGSVLAARAARLRITCRSLPAGGGPADAVTGTVVSAEPSHVAAVVGARHVQLARLPDPGVTAAAVAAARQASLVPVCVPERDSVVIAVAAAVPGAEGLAGALAAAGITSTAIDGLGLVSVISQAGRAVRELVPLSRLDERVAEVHACTASAAGHWPAVLRHPLPAPRKSPHSGLLTGEPR
jgi:aspartate kinase